MGQVVQMKKYIDYAEVPASVVEVLPEEVLQPVAVRKNSWLGHFVALATFFGYGSGFWLSMHYGQRIYVNAVADGLGSSTARAISVIPAAALCGLFIAATLCVIFVAWTSPYKWARWIRGE